MIKSERLLKPFLAIVLAVALLTCAVLAWKVLSPVKSEQLALKVSRGDSASSIAQTLKKRGIIRSTVLFTTLAKLRGSDRRLIAGTYTMGGTNSLLQTLRLLEKGNTSAVRITFPEGLSLHQTLLRIDRSGLATYAALDSLASDPDFVYELTGLRAPSLEGFLYPETYAFDISLTPREILQTMTQQFDRKLKSASIDFRSQPRFYDRLILASIVERESGPPKERKIVAGVLANRLNKGMRLESCSTVDYILEQQGVSREVLSFEDTRIPSPYNTYINDGLPPGPICNPSLSSIQAALDPAKTDFLFFVADRKGGNEFSVTAEEHFQKIKKYRGSDWL